MSGWHADEEGQTLIFIALGVLVLVTAFAVAVGAGQQLAARRALQDAVDAGAVAGAVVIYQGGTVADVRAAATGDVARNGFPIGGSTTVSVNQPPTSGPHTGDAVYAEVIATSTVRPLLFIGGGSISARAVAGPLNAPVPPAIMTLGDMSASGSSQITVSGGDVVVSNDVSTAGSSQIAAPGHQIVVGHAASGGGYAPPPVIGVPPPTDPYAGFPPPPTAGLVARTCCSALMQPGIYDGGMDLGANSAAVLLPGIYILRGGGLQLGGSSSLSGTGVMLFNTTTTYPASGGSCGAISFGGDASWVLSAPTSGVYKGLLLYEDPACSDTISLGGSTSGTALSGTIYAPSAGVTLGGSADLVLNSGIVARTISAESSSSITITYTTLDAARPRTAPALGE
jgi:hypothetical protein